MALSEECAARLENWKFAQARDCLEESGATAEEQAAVRALADAYGDAGWFNGTDADGVRSALRPLIGDAADAGQDFRDAVRGQVAAFLEAHGAGRAPPREVTCEMQPESPGGMRTGRGKAGAVRAGEVLRIRHGLGPQVIIGLYDAASGDEVMAGTVHHGVYADVGPMPACGDLLVLVAG